MAYTVGQELEVISGSYPGGYLAAGERVTVLAIEEDTGVPIVGILGTEDKPIGKAVRLHPELEEHFASAS
jgi:hypothetical protein